MKFHLKFGIRSIHYVKFWMHISLEGGKSDSVIEFIVIFFRINFYFEPKWTIQCKRTAQPHPSFIQNTIKQRTLCLFSTTNFVIQFICNKFQVIEIVRIFLCTYMCVCICYRNNFFMVSSFKLVSTLALPLESIWLLRYCSNLLYLILK